MEKKKKKFYLDVETLRIKTRILEPLQVTGFTLTFICFMFPFSALFKYYVKYKKVQTLKQQREVHLI
jgi:hypothetical protein